VRLNLMSVRLSSGLFLSSRRKAASDVSPRLILPPGMPHLPDHLCVRIISTSFRALKISPPTVASGDSVLSPAEAGASWKLFFSSPRWSSRDAPR